MQDGKIAKNMRSKFNKDEIDILLTEYQMHREEMRVFIEFHRRDTQISFVIIAAVIALLSKGGFNNNYVIMVIPSMIFVLYLAQMLNAHQIKSSARACGCIEKKINSIYDMQLMVWESELVPYYMSSKRSITSFSSYGIIALYYIIFIITFSIFIEYNDIRNDLFIIIYYFLHISELAYMFFISYFWIFCDRKACYDEKAGCNKDCFTKLGIIK